MHGISHFFGWHKQCGLLHMTNASAKTSVDQKNLILKTNFKTKWWQNAWVIFFGWHKQCGLLRMTKGSMKTSVD